MSAASVTGKILITGELRLKSPLLIGDGAGETAENFRDIHVLKNAAGSAFIPGTSICGVLREYVADTNPALVEKIFGDADKFQSAIQFDDVQLEGGAVVVRDGVRIDGVTGTGVKGYKYDYEAVDRGAGGEIRMLVNLRGCHDTGEIQNAVAEILGALESGIRLGALTSKGFGLAVVENLTADFYDFRNAADVKAWLLGGAAANKIQAVGRNFASANDFVVDAEFALDSSFIVRDYEVGAADREKNISAASLRSGGDFVIPGTSLKGIFRHRAEYILSRLGVAARALNKLMGDSSGDAKIKSRFIVAESYVSAEKIGAIPHTRNKIDRFTGGTLQGTLFTTKPAWNKNSATLKIRFEIQSAADFEAGLALFLLRDIWLGHVALGGEKSIGRGTVHGISASIDFHGKNYRLDSCGKVVAGDAEELAEFTAAVKNWGESA